MSSHLSTSVKIFFTPLYTYQDLPHTPLHLSRSSSHPSTPVRIFIPTHYSGVLVVSSLTGENKNASTWSFNPSLLPTGANTSSPASRTAIQHPNHPTGSRQFQRESKVNVAVLTNISGTISIQSNTSSEYLPGGEWLWIIDLGSDDEYSIDLNVTYLDLRSTHVIHDKNASGHSYTTGDFMMVGAGDSLLSGSQEVFFYGLRKRLKSVHILGPVGHVYLRTHLLPDLDPHAVYGFQLDYTRTGEVSTVPTGSTTTTLPIPPDVYNVSAWVALNGLTPEEGWKETYQLRVREAVAGMTSEYVAKEQLQLTEDITWRSVMVLDVKTCHPQYCWSRCVAYNISLHAFLADTDERVFTSSLLTTIFATTSNHHYWTNMPESCQVCKESSLMVLKEVNSWGMIIGVLALASAITLVACIAQRKIDYGLRRKEFLKRQREIEEERRRRSSGELSTLGLGGSLASRTSRRHSLPFPMKRTDSQTNDDDVDDDPMDN
ncbi:hypothetical protein Hamer_G004193 [Homarus americanus]|uniref:Uncharacterized protein n=1 Tax=Homarus americanus TaxID=6706 RepID=A0A8J5JPZ5_HOMAM|nr:hypothetical protein Hamer_G004193 [Homarus americanus]